MRIQKFIKKSENIILNEKLYKKTMENAKN